MNQLVIDCVPSTIKHKAQLLVSLQKNIPNVSWEDDGTVKLYGKSIPGSNIIDLVNDDIVTAVKLQVGKLLQKV